jgi:hypothetical protein
VAATVAGEGGTVSTVEEKVHTLHDMAEHEHVEQAYRLMAQAADYSRTAVEQSVHATLAVAHLLLAADKQRDPRSTRHGRR